MTDDETKLADVLLDSLIGSRQNVAGKEADRLRFACIQALSDALSADADEIIVLVDQRIQQHKETL